MDAILSFSYGILHFQSCIQLEVNQAMGYKYQVVAVASVKCWELVTSAGGKVHGKAVLVGAEAIKDCVSVGGVEYWMCLKLPITQAAKLHQVGIELYSRGQSVTCACGGHPGDPSKWLL